MKDKDKDLAGVGRKKKIVNMGIKDKDKIKVLRG